MYVLIFILSYLIIGNLLHWVIFREKIPNISTYFQPGQEFYSKAEGVRQIISKQENGLVYGSMEMGPFAGGPPKHIHQEFDEIFAIENGELSMWVNGEIKKIRPGEALLIPKGVSHKPFNETGETIRIKDAVPFPEKFAFYLTQIYGVLDDQPGFGKSPKILLQLALFNTAGFDSYIADGPPIFLQKAMAYFIAPLARLLGYKSYYKKYDPHFTQS